MGRVLIRAISCPSCGGTAGNLAPGEVRSCPYCEIPLTLVGAGVAGSVAIDPEVPLESARHQVEAFLASKGTPEGLKELSSRRGIDLVYVPFYDMMLVEAAEERPPLRCRMAVARLTATALEEDGRDVGADRIDLERVRFSSARSFDAAYLAARAIVLQPQRKPDDINLPGVLTAPVAIERRVRVVYYPVWVARFSYGHSLYQISLDGVTGTILRGVAPSDFKRRLLAGIGFTLLASLFVNFVLLSPRVLIGLLAHAADVGALVLAGFLFALAAAWDRLRFRRELVVEGSWRRFLPINRPKETVLERMARSVLRSATRGRSGAWLTLIDER